jgi:hypothetical protein
MHSTLLFAVRHLPKENAMSYHTSSTHHCYSSHHPQTVGEGYMLGVSSTMYEWQAGACICIYVTD